MYFRLGFLAYHVSKKRNQIYFIYSIFHRFVLPLIVRNVNIFWGSSELALQYLNHKSVIHNPET